MASFIVSSSISVPLWSSFQDLPKLLPGGQNCFHDNTKMVFAFCTVLAFELMVCGKSLLALSEI